MLGTLDFTGSEHWATFNVSSSTALKQVEEEFEIKHITHLTIFSYSLSFPFESLHFLNITEASTLAGENVLGSFNKEITLKRIVLKTRYNSMKVDFCMTVFGSGSILVLKSIYSTETWGKIIS